ncbi:MAG: tetratricopeptide repeat protein [Gammaproteobacteria bacterium]
MENNAHSRSKLIDAIGSPLGFYVLSLLIVEAFIASVMISQKLDIALVYVGVGLFIFVVIIVTVLVWMKAGVLTFDKAAHLEMERIRSELSRQVSQTTELETQLRNALRHTSQQRYVEAIVCYDRALKIDETNEEALIGRAVSQSYVQPNELEGPIHALEEVLKRYPRSGRVLYNLACLHCLAGYPRSQWLGELRKALTYAPEMTDFARRDKDFEKWSHDPEFSAMVGFFSA